MNGCTAGSRHAINVGAIGRYSSPSLVVLGQSLIHIDSAPVTRNHCAKSGTVVAHCFSQYFTDSYAYSVHKTNAC